MPKTTRKRRTAHDLVAYNEKRDFQRTREPRGRPRAVAAMRFVVHEHWASHHHFDFRLEMGRVLVSWAVPKGPSMDPTVRRLAVQVEDHPVDYIDFAGRIPEGSYGAGKVEIWDHGSYALLDGGDPVAAHASGHLSFVLSGRRLRGGFSLVRMESGRTSGKEWLLIKARDSFARTEKTADRGHPLHPARTRAR